MTHKRSQQKPRIVRGLYTLWAGSFLFFLFYSAPHRVHHFFDQVRPASHAVSGDHHDETDQRDKVPSASDCVFQAAANRCAFGLTAHSLALTQTLFVQELIAFHESIGQQQFLTSAFQIRAPPKA
jgi:hypothetical protein